MEDYLQKLRDATRLPDYGYSIEGQITPALVVHTGPGLIGIGIQRLD